MAALGLSVEGLLEAKKAPEFGPWAEDQNAKNFLGLVLPFLNQKTSQKHQVRVCTMMRLQQGCDLPTPPKKAEGAEVERGSLSVRASALLLYLPWTSTELIDPEGCNTPPWAKPRNPTQAASMQGRFAKCIT